MTYIDCKCSIYQDKTIAWFMTTTEHVTLFKVLTVCCQAKWSFLTSNMNEGHMLRDVKCMKYDAEMTSEEMILDPGQHWTRF